MKRLNKIIALIILVIIGSNVYSQSNKLEPAQILQVDINQETNTVDAVVLAPKINNAVFNANTAKFRENVKGRWYPMDWDGFEEVGRDNQQTYSIVFVLDWSGSMRNEDRLIKAKEAIFQTIQSVSLPPGSKFFLSAFHNDIFDNVEVNKGNIEQELNKYFVPPRGQGKSTDLYRAMIYKGREMNQYEGKRVLIFLSDGENDLTGNAFYRSNPPFTPDDVFRSVVEEDNRSDLIFYTIGLGSSADSTFLKQIPAITKDTTDKYIYSERPDQLVQIFLSILSQYSVKYNIKLRTRKPEYEGENRHMVMEWTAKGLPSSMVAQYYYAGGSVMEPVNLSVSESSRTPLFWAMFFAIGVAIIGGLLAILMYLVPYLKKREFKKNFVIPYVPEANKIKRDPITQDAFDEGDLVVVKCKQMTSLGTWEALGHCPNYPNCMEFSDPCNGAGGEDMQVSFFSQQGIFRVLNWLWFGAVGGFGAWILYAIVQILNLTGLDDAVGNWFNSEGPREWFMEYQGGEFLLKNIPELIDQTLLGLFLGVCLILAIAIVEERGTSRRFSIWRILVRGFIGVFLSFTIFFFSYMFQYLILDMPFVVGIISWALFGVGFGSILSINSTVELKRGIIGGVISSLICYLIFFGILIVTPNDILAKLIALITLGGVLGALIATVISNLEDFELIYLSPQEYAGMVKPISKWLKKGMEIYIGRSSKCYVFVKWEDAVVEDRHAKLIYDGGNVHIIPLFETLVNGVIVPENQKTPLENSDIIQLGRYSISKMQYKEKRS